jgi:hypothetical protein
MSVCLHVIVRREAAGDDALSRLAVYPHRPGLSRPLHGPYTVPTRPLQGPLHHSHRIHCPLGAKQGPSRGQAGAHKQGPSRGQAGAKQGPSRGQAGPSRAKQGQAGPSRAKQGQRMVRCGREEVPRDGKRRSCGWSNGTPKTLKNTARTARSVSTPLCRQ